MSLPGVGPAIRAVLLTPEPRDKIFLARRTARDWRLGRLAHSFAAAMPDRPTRSDRLELVAPNRMPKRGKGGSLRGRIALLHAIAHIEYVAIDLAFDMAGRFGHLFPPGFVDDWMHVGADEAMHFALLDRRLRALGSHYGAMPAHDGLWEAARETAHDPLARLAVVPMVLEARGLDVTPMMIERFSAAGDEASAMILRRIMTDEIRHVSAGTKWFHWACRWDDSEPVNKWKTLINSHFHGELKPPFNDSARSAAGLTQEFYR